MHFHEVHMLFGFILAHVEHSSWPGGRDAGLRYMYLRGVIRDSQVGFAALWLLARHDAASR